MNRVASRVASYLRSLSYHEYKIPGQIADAVNYLLAKFPESVSITRRIISENDSGIRELNHFNWAKKPDYFANMIRKWRFLIYDC